MRRARANGPRGCDRSRRSGGPHYTYQFEVARAAWQNGTDTYVLISSAGASAKLSVFYSRMKGELERDTAALEFPRARFLHPGPLDGGRQESRTAERWALRLLRPLAPLLPAIARPIHASIVARAGIPRPACCATGRPSCSASALPRRSTGRDPARMASASSRINTRNRGC